jgi:acetyl esterase/lipase/plastocyanin
MHTTGTISRRLGLIPVGAIFVTMLTAAPGSHAAELDGPSTTISSGPNQLTADAGASFSFWASRPIETIPEVEYGTAADGTPLLLDIYRPSGEGKWPGVLVIHGGGWKAGTRGVVKKEAVALATAGFAAFAVDFRLAPGNKGDDVWPAQINDLRMALTYVRGLSYVTSKVGAFGVSSGGHLAQYLGTSGSTGDTRADSVASLAGPSKLEIVNPENPAYEEAVANLLGCGLKACPHLWERASPYHQVDVGTMPMFLAQSLDDPLVHIDQIRAMDALLDWLGRPHVVRETSKPGHVDAVEASVWSQMIMHLWRFLGPAAEAVTYACTLDGVDRACDANIAQFTNIVPGQHSFSVQATDDEGQTGPPATWNWSVADKTVAVEIRDDGFLPGATSVAQGAAVEWVFAATENHTVTDGSKVALFHSGLIVAEEHPGVEPVYGTPFLAAGSYSYVCRIAPGMGGTVVVPIMATPPAGGLDTPFTITWAALEAPAALEFDVQIKRPGSFVWVDLWIDQKQPGATFLPDAGPGVYQFRARLQQAGKPYAVGYSPLAAVLVA